MTPQNLDWGIKEDISLPYSQDLCHRPKMNVVVLLSKKGKYSDGSVSF